MGCYFVNDVTRSIKQNFTTKNGHTQKKTKKNHAKLVRYLAWQNSQNLKLPMKGGSLFSKKMIM